MCEGKYKPLRFQNPCIAKKDTWNLLYKGALLVVHTKISIFIRLYMYHNILLFYLALHSDVKVFFYHLKF